MPKAPNEAAALYIEVGRRIRAARKRAGLQLSQEKLAKRLNMSRVSVVNIEAGRQRAPLYLLWQIANAINTELALLIPRRDELTPQTASSPLDTATVKIIKEVAKGDTETQKAVTDLASRLKGSIEMTNTEKTS